MNNKAKTITRKEWIELSLLTDVVETFEYRDFRDLLRMVYGAKYNYPGTDYDGTIYTLVNVTNDGIKTLVFERDGGVLKSLK